MYKVCLTTPDRVEANRNIRAIMMKAGTLKDCNTYFQKAKSETKGLPDFNIHPSTPINAVNAARLTALVVRLYSPLPSGP